MSDTEIIEAAYQAEIERCAKLREAFPRPFADQAIIAGWTLQQAQDEFNKRQK